MRELLELKLHGRIVPKARPRVSRGHAYLPANYRLWKDWAITSIIDQLPLGFRTYSQACVAVQLQGSLRGDADNLAGAILDVLVQSQVLRDDRLSCVPKLIVRYTKQGGPGATITLLGVTS
jgi:Holliday junction resolvase RusA-like endonuclease